MVVMALSWWDSISNGIYTAITYLVNIINSILQAVVMLTSGITVVNQLMFWMPAVISGCIIATVTVFVVRFIVGK